MRRFDLVLRVTFASAVAVSLSAKATLIDFETAPGGGPPVDDAPLSTPYNISGGGTVRFYFDANANNTFDSGTDINPIFEAAGADAVNGFSNAVTGIPDTASGGLGAQLGTFFLRQPVTGAVPPPFIADYNTTQIITQLSGEIWDIDGSQGGTEQWRVDILDNSNALLATQLSPLGNSSALDGLPWAFSFTSLPLGVEKVRLTFVGTKTTGVGLAFNNFNPTLAAPEPSSLLLAGTAAIALTIHVMRRRNVGRRQVL